MSERFNVADIFGENVFNDTVMKERLPKNVYKNLKLTMEGVQELSLADADVIANAMKDWAIEKGATHYTHWFQPLTGTTAEKHDSFISAPKSDGKVLMEFSGKELIQVVFVLHSRQEDIQHGIVHLLHLYAKVLRVLLFVFLQHSALTQVKLLTRKLHYFVQWMPSTSRLFVF